MSMINPLFYRHKRQFLVQAICLVLFMAAVLSGLDQVSLSRLSWAVGASSMASSAFIIFATPRKRISEPKRLLGGYVLCMLVGIAFHTLLTWGMNDLSWSPAHLDELIIAFALGMSMFLMTVLRMQHPPAIGMALALVLEPWGIGTIMVIVVAIVILAIARTVFEKQFINLIS